MPYYNILYYLDTEAYVDATCKAISCSVSCYDRCDQCKKAFYHPHFVGQNCNDEFNIAAPTRKRRPKRNTATNDCGGSSEMITYVQYSSKAVFDESAVPDELPVELRRRQNG